MHTTRTKQYVNRAPVGYVDSIMGWATWVVGWIGMMPYQARHPLASIQCSGAQTAASDSDSESSMDLSDRRMSEARHAAAHATH